MNRSWRSLAIHLGVSLAVTILVLLLTQDWLLDVPPLKRSELSLVDMRFQHRGALPMVMDSSDVVIVEISQESFKSLPARWPWPKSYYARLVRNLRRAGARAIGLDIVFSPGDKSTTVDEDEFRLELHGADNVVLAGKLESEHHTYTRRENIEAYGNAFIDSTQRVGLVNAREDVDGILRRYMPFAYDETQGVRIPTFSFAVLNVFLHHEPDFSAEVSEDAFYYAGRIIPKYDPTSFLINYHGPSGTFRRIKFADVLDDSTFTTTEEASMGEETNTFDDPDYGYISDRTFKDKIVLVGSTMPEDKDLFSVPIAEGRQEGDNRMYGVEIHANVIQNVLDRNFIVPQPSWITALVVFGVSLFTFVLTSGLKLIKTRFSTLMELLGIAILLSIMFLIFWSAVMLFEQQHYLTEMMSPFLAVISCYIGSTVYSYITERKQKVLIKNMFSRYVNPTVVDELVAHPEKLRLGGERRNLTVFFSDIEQFTGISEKMQPEELVLILNEYLTAMTEIIIEHNGTLDKYEGDAIVAFWGAPIPQPDHALRACKTAIAMQERLSDMRNRWKGEGKPLLNVRIGINSGEMIVGNMGGRDRFDYTVIGDSVNLGARLEGANKQYRTNLMISQSTYDLVRDHVVVRELDMLVVAGKTEPMRVYELLAMTQGALRADRVAFLEHYASGLRLYRHREWNEALQQFQRALKLSPEDYPTQMYIERTHIYHSSPPPDDWNGNFIMRTK